MEKIIDTFYVFFMTFYGKKLWKFMETFYGKHYI